MEAIVQRYVIGLDHTLGHQTDMTRETHTDMKIMIIDIRIIDPEAMIDSINTNMITHITMVIGNIASDNNTTISIQVNKNCITELL